MRFLHSKSAAAAAQTQFSSAPAAAVEAKCHRDGSSCTTEEKKSVDRLNVYMIWAFLFSRLNTLPHRVYTPHLCSFSHDMLEAISNALMTHWRKFRQNNFFLSFSWCVSRQFQMTHDRTFRFTGESTKSNQH